MSCPWFKNIVSGAFASVQTNTSGFDTLKPEEETMPTSRLFCKFSLAFAVLGLLPLDALHAQTATGTDALNGLTEQYEDWTVSCGASGDVLICTMGQDVRRSAGSEPLISIRVDLAASTQPRVTLILPLGLDLESDILLFARDLQVPLATLRPTVCQPVGCYFFLTVDADNVEILSSSVALRVRMRPFNDELREVPISLRGFQQALDRLRDLQG